MPQVSVTDSDKERFDELKPSDSTHKEFFAEMLRTYENADEPVTIDVEQLTEDIKTSVASEVHLAAYNGVTEAIEQANE